MCFEFLLVILRCVQDVTGEKILITITAAWDQPGLKTKYAVRRTTYMLIPIILIIESWIT